MFDTQMTDDEIEAYLNSPEVAKRAAETAERTANAIMSLQEGGQARATQQALDKLGNGLRSVRQQLGRSLSDVAGEIGTSPQMLSLLESGLVSREEFDQFCDDLLNALGITYAELEYRVMKKITQGNTYQR